MLDLVTHERATPDAPAMTMAGQGTLTYRELADMVGRVGRSLRSDDKSLVLCAGDRDLPTVLAYLAALRLGHTVAFLPDSPDIVAAYQPDFVVPAPGAAGPPDYVAVECPEPGVRILRRRARPVDSAISPDTALLLGTSGSTGSPKAVRLSYTGVTENIDSVVRALGITAVEHAASLLPITHAFGLSVFNTHLRVGGSILLTDRRPLSLGLWDELGRAGVTSFSAVPTTYAGLGPSHLKLLARTKIRTMTQAGARLDDELALRLWRLMDQRGGQFFAMYGQTEAAGRISCLDPADLPTRLGSVGVAIPGGTITVTTSATHSRVVQGEGDVYYTGPGVMLGYAERRADLGRAGGPTTLATGDLGYLRDGFLYLTGRTKRIVKMFGLRYSLDELERVVVRPGHPAALVADKDDVMFLVGAGDADVHEAQRRSLVELLGVPGRCVVFRAVRSIPRTPSGKVDYRALRAIATGPGQSPVATGPH